MKRALKRLISLYPQAWRSRYAKEFDALLDEVPPTWRTFFDVLGGAIKMQMTVWSAGKSIAAFGIAGAIAAGIFSLTIADRYISTAVIKVADEQDMRALTQRALSSGTLARLIAENNLYNAERARTPIEDLVARMRDRDVSIRRKGPKEFSINYIAADAASARRGVSSLTSEVIDEAIRTRAEIAFRSGSEIHGKLELVKAASLPERPSDPRRSRDVLMGLGVGILAGALFAVFKGLRVWRLAVGLGVGGAVLGALVSYAVPDRYLSTAVVTFPAGTQAENLIDSVTSPEKLSWMIQQLGLYSGARDAQRNLRDHLRLQPIGIGTLLIRFDDSDQATAQKVTQQVVILLTSDSLAKVETIDPASRPYNPYFPNRAAVGGTGLCVGLAGAILVGLRRVRAAVPLVAG